MNFETNDLSEVEEVYEKKITAQVKVTDDPSFTLRNEMAFYAKNRRSRLGQSLMYAIGQTMTEKHLPMEKVRAACKLSKRSAAAMNCMNTEEFIEGALALEQLAAVNRLTTYLYRDIVIQAVPMLGNPSPGTISQRLTDATVLQSEIASFVSKLLKQSLQPKLAQLFASKLIPGAVDGSPSLCLSNLISMAAAAGWRVNCSLSSMAYRKQDTSHRR